jgi:catechol 2,3-dioxygenase-like lactoylglutathione lyase family enzyme
VDVGLTHVALTVRDAEASRRFYEAYAGLRVVHRRVEEGSTVLWLSDRTRPFVVVLLERPVADPPLAGWQHLGVGLPDRASVDRLAARARAEGRLVSEPLDHGGPVGYVAILRDPDGHQLELSHGQEVGLTVTGEDGARP